MELGRVMNYSVNLKNYTIIIFPVRRIILSPHFEFGLPLAKTSYKGLEILILNGTAYPRSSVAIVVEDAGWIELVFKLAR